jgi:hypothetical protein
MAHVECTNERCIDKVDCPKTREFPPPRIGQIMVLHHRRQGSLVLPWLFFPFRTGYSADLDSLSGVTKICHIYSMGDVERIESAEQFNQILKANQKVVAEFSATWYWMLI